MRDMPEDTIVRVRSATKADYAGLGAVFDEAEAFHREA